MFPVFCSTSLSSGLSTREESRTPDGTVHGSYSYVDPDGRLITNNYVADSSGFRYIKISPFYDVVLKMF